MPVIAGDMNLLQDAIVNGSVGDTTEPLPVSGRFISSGTWQIATSSTNGLGSLSEATNGSLCFVSFRPPPLRARITGAACKLTDGGGTSFLRVRLLRENDDTSSTVMGSVTSAGAGTQQVLAVPFGGFEYEVGPSMGGGRFVFEVSTTGGGGGTRRLYELYITWYRP